jgi:hypothetical protein
MATDSCTRRQVAHGTDETPSKWRFGTSHKRFFVKHDLAASLLSAFDVRCGHVHVANGEQKKVRWRIYRLPGSREFWHIDNGPGTQIVNVKAFHIECPCTSVDEGGHELVRAWIEVNMANLYIQNGTALFVGMDYKVSLEAQA